jgi:hypothetical protein
MNSIVYNFVNGIRTFPGDSDNWNGKAVTATLTRGPACAKAEKVEYYTLAVTRGMLQKHRAEKLNKVLNRYLFHWGSLAGNRIHLVAHSNGADVVLDALKAEQAIYRSIEHPFKVDLISPAVSSDCNKNGITDLMKTGVIGDLRIWIAGKDRALRLGGSAIGRLFGYGTLGLDGPKPGTLQGAPAGVRTIHEMSFGHSDWFTDDQFDKTMDRIWTFS